MFTGTFVSSVSIVRFEAADLQECFRVIVLNTRNELKSQTNVQILAFLKAALLTFLTPSGFFSFLKTAYDVATNADKLFDEIDPHWNYFNYDFLKSIINFFDSREIKHEMMEYIRDLEMFMKKTTVKDWYMASVNIPPALPNYETVDFTLGNNPNECTLYEIHQLREDFTAKADIKYGGISVTDFCMGSVKVKIAVAPKLSTKVSKVMNSSKFMADHKIVETKWSFSESSSDNKHYVKGEW